MESFAETSTLEIAPRIDAAAIQCKGGCEVVTTKPGQFCRFECGCGRWMCEGISWAKQ